MLRPTPCTGGPSPQTRPAARGACARGDADEVHGTGVRVLLVRPGFVIGRMTEGMAAAPLATTPEAVSSREW